MAESMGSWFKSKLERIAEIIEETAEDAAEKGESITKHHIETRGTAKSGKRGRIETGRMRDAVKGSVSDKTATSATARFGWLEGSPEYAKYQEPGFKHRGGVTVEGMYALTDAGEEVIQDAKEDLRSKLRDL